MMTRTGACPSFQVPHGKVLKEQWASSKVSPSLRAAILTAAMIYYEEGASRCRILRILGNTPEELESLNGHYRYGAAADIAINELVDGRHTLGRKIMDRRFAKVERVVERINKLFPTEGGRQTAEYRGDHIHIEVPPAGFRHEHQAFATWFEFGPVGDRSRP